MPRALPTIAILTSLLFLAPAISEASSADPAVPSSPVALAPACFNFRDVTDYKISGPTQISLKTKGGQSYDLALMGAACLSGDKMASITRVPIMNLCLGPPPVQREITFTLNDATSVTCRIANISPSAAAPK